MIRSPNARSSALGRPPDGGLETAVSDLSDPSEAGGLTPPRVHVPRWQFIRSSQEVLVRPIQMVVAAVFLAACSGGDPASPTAPGLVASKLSASYNQSGKREGRRDGRRNGQGDGRRDAHDWVVMTYVPDNGYTVPVPFPVTKVRDGGISFAFLATPDRSMLLTDQLPDKIRDGYSISGRIAIIAAPGTTFNYCGTACDGSDAGGFVRFYIEGTNPALVGCLSGWHPERPDCEAQYWWSNPVHIDLADLAALGTTGINLNTLLKPENWSDRDGHSGTAVITSSSITVDHAAAFHAAITHATRTGLSFGGGDNFAFGAGASPLPATFVLARFEIKK
jgi:hypothetical protein